MSHYSDDILEDGEGMTLKGISGGAPKKRTPRPIQPPGVYVNGKAKSKSERALMEQSSLSFSESSGAIPAKSSQSHKKHAESLKMDQSQLDEFEEMTKNGSSVEFKAYSDYSINIRKKLEMDLNAVLDMLDQASGEASHLKRESTNEQPNYIDNDDDFNNKELLSLLEERNQEVENQLTAVWDELLIKDEAQKHISTDLEKAHRELSESQNKAAQEISQYAAKLNLYKAQVTELHDELEKSKIETGSLHEQVDALRQKLSMEEASKKSLKGQLERAHAELKKKESQARDRSELRQDLKRAMKLRAFTGTVSIFAWYMQVRSLALKISEKKEGGMVTSFSDAVSMSSTSMMINNNERLRELTDWKGWQDKEEIREYLEDAMRDDKLEEACERLDSISSRERAQRELNAHLLSTIAAMKGTIQVYCRIRPYSVKERQQDRVEDSRAISPGSVGRGVQALSVNEVGVYDTYNQSWRSITFDRVWGPETSQTDLFLEIEPLALSVVDGEPCCIMAYGQTGSGKTYTMHGDNDKNLGISYRTMHKIFTLLELHRSKHQKNGDIFEAKVQVSIVEVYNDEVHDLLAIAQSSGSRASQPLEVRAASNAEPTVVGLSWHSTATLQDAIALFDAGCNARATTSTILNHSSSRSHMVMMIEVCTVLNHGTPKSAKLHLVDLAGSERVKQSEATGQTLREAQHINKSLSALGDVMEALDNKSSFIPYRNSKLTMLLQGCLGTGPSRTAMVVTCCPTKSTAEESNYTLQFGSRCRRISTSIGNSGSQVKNLEEALKVTKNELKLLSKDRGNSETIRRLESEKAELVAALSSMRKQLAHSSHSNHHTSSEDPPPPPPQPIPSPMTSSSSFKFPSSRTSHDRIVKPSSSPSHKSSSRDRGFHQRSGVDSHHTSASPIPSSPLASGPKTRPNTTVGVPSYTASVASIKDSRSKTKKPIEDDEGNHTSSSSSIRSFMRMRQTRSKDNVDTPDSPKASSSLDRMRKPPPPPKSRDLLGGMSRRTTSPASESAAEKYGFLGGGTTPRSARTSSDSVNRSSRSNSANRFFGKLSDHGSNPLRSTSGSTSRSIRTNSSERLDPSPASRRADAAKKHAARMQAVRASSGKGRWGNSI